MELKALEGLRSAAEIRTSRPAPYAAFLLVEPLRLVVDVEALPGDSLTVERRTNDPCVERIVVAPPEPDGKASRLTFHLARRVVFEAQSEGNSDPPAAQRR